MVLGLCTWFSFNFQSRVCKSCRPNSSLIYAVRHKTFSLKYFDTILSHQMFFTHQGSHLHYPLRLSSSFSTVQSISLCESTLQYQRAVAPMRGNCMSGTLSISRCLPCLQWCLSGSFEDQSMSISQRMMNVPSSSDWHAYPTSARNHLCVVHACSPRPCSL